MPFFSPAHSQDLVNQFWSDGRARCPHDGGELATHFRPHPGNYLLALACLYCGKKVQVTRYSDPLRNGFRAWTAQDIARLTHAHRARTRPLCPVCHTGVSDHEIEGSSIHILECPRCGNRHHDEMLSELYMAEDVALLSDAT